MKHSILDILKEQSAGFKTPKEYFETVENDVFSKLSTKDFPEKVGYSIPKGYFETLEDTILTKVETHQFSKEHQFDVPKDYFDTLEDTIFKKIREEGNNKPKVLSLSSKLIKIITPIAIAASVLLLITLYTNKTNNGDSFDSLAATDIENWIENDYISLDSYEIAEVYNDVNFEDEFDEDDLELLDYMNGTDIESVLLTD